METSVWLVLLLALCCSAASAQTSVRLVDGSAPYEGRVDFFINNTWGSICSYNFGYYEMRMVCRTLGYAPGSETRTLAAGFFENPSSPSPMLPLYISCSYSTSSLDSCSRYVSSSYLCSSDLHAGVVCKSPAHPPMQVRLMDGRTSTYSAEGRVEVLIDDTWGTICDYGLGSDEARVICRMLGYDSGSHYIQYDNFYGLGPSPLLIARVGCNYPDTNLSTCVLRNSSVSTCPDSQVAGVFCNFTNTDVDLSVRLVGPFPNEGTLEILVNGKWYKTCGSSGHLNLAKVVCRQLKLTISEDDVTFKLTYIASSAQLSNQVFMNIYCSGSEHDLGNCTLNQPIGSGSCVNQYEFGVLCYPGGTETSTPTAAAIVTTAGMTEGKLEKAMATDASTDQPIVAMVILGVTLALALIINLVLVVFLWRDRRKGAAYAADCTGGGRGQDGQSRAAEAVYMNAAFQSHPAASEAPAPAAPTESEHSYESLQRDMPQTMK